jgi:hypothetical protein
MMLVHTLICHRDLAMAAHNLLTLKRNSTNPVRFLLHDDGTLTEADADCLRVRLGEVDILWRREADQMAGKFLAAHPKCLAFRRSNVFGLKLFDITFNGEPQIAYCDADVVFFRPFEELFQIPDQWSAVFMRDIYSGVACSPQDLWSNPKLLFPKRANAGLMCIRSGLLDLEFVEWLLGLELLHFRTAASWIEQMCWGALAARKTFGFYDPKQIVMVSNRTHFSQKMVAGHFATSRSRDRISEFVACHASMPTNSLEPERVKFVPARILSPLSLVMERMEMKLPPSWRWSA